MSEKILMYTPSHVYCFYVYERETKRERQRQKNRQTKKQRINTEIDRSQK